MRSTGKCEAARALCTSTRLEKTGEGKIPRSRLMSSSISAVELCIKNGHWAEAFYLAAICDPQLTRTVQDHYLKAFDMMDTTAQGQPNWRRLVRFCDLERWENTLKVLVSNVHNEEELSSLVGLLGRRLELSGNERLRRSAVACWLCTGNLDAAAKVWSTTKSSIVASSDLEFLQDLRKCLDVWKKGVDNGGNSDHSFLSAPAPRPMYYQQWSASLPMHQMPSSYIVPSSFNPNQYHKPAFPAFCPPCFMPSAKVPVVPSVPHTMTRPTIPTPAFNTQPQLQFAAVPPPVAVISRSLSPKARPFTPKNSSTEPSNLLSSAEPANVLSSVEPSKRSSSSNGTLARFRSPSETSTASTMLHISEVSSGQFDLSDEDFYEEPSCEEIKCDVDLTKNVRNLICKYCRNGYMDSKTDDTIFSMILSKAEYWKTKFDTSNCKE